MVQEIRVSPTKTEVHNIPVGLSEVLQIRKRTAAECESCTDTKARTRAGYALPWFHARAPFQPLLKTNRRHTHSHNDRSFNAVLRCGTTMRSWITGSLLQ